MSPGSSRRSDTGAVRSDPARGAGLRHEEDRREVEPSSTAGKRRQREGFGGINLGAAFKWLLAAGMAAILIASLSAAGAAIGLTSVSSSDVTANADTIGIGAGVPLLIVLLLAYYSDGYVAGRMSRFDGGRQGFGVWALGILITLLFAAAAVILGSKYNVLAALNLPRILIKEGALATGGAIALATSMLGTLFASAVGGRTGRRYHGKADALAYERQSVA